MTTYLLDGNANSERIDGTFNKHFFFLISADRDWCQQQFLACSNLTKIKYIQLSEKPTDPISSFPLLIRKSDSNVIYSSYAMFNFTILQAIFDNCHHFKYFIGICKAVLKLLLDSHNVKIYEWLSFLLQRY